MNPLLAPVTNRDTYRALLFLIAAVPTGTLWAATLIAGWTVSTTLLITPLVIPIVIGFGAAVALAARVECGLARELLGARTYPPRLDAVDGGLVGKARNVITDSVFWKTQSYLALRLLAGAPIAVVVLALFGSGLFYTTAPIHYRWLPQHADTRGIDFGIWEADTFAKASLLIPLGLVIVVLAFHLVAPLAVLWRILAYRLLGGSMSDVDYQPLTAVQLRRGVSIHAMIVGGISALLVMIWALTTRDYFWPMWPVLALSLPLAIHAWVTQLLVKPELAPIRLGRAFAIHAGTSTALSIFCTLIWVAAGGGYFWPIWPMLGLSVALVVHLIVSLMFPRQVELEQRIDVLTATRAGAVNAQEEELRRIERDLHDGAQARLVALGMSLGMAEQKLASDPDSVRRLISEARQGAREALEELRDLARGIHPPILADRGLGAAVAALAARSPLRVNVSVEGERPPAAVESAAYFVAAESLANASKHASPSHVDIHIARENRQLIIEVTDDGHGGADADGPGLTGLRRRVEALDGTLHLVSPPGGPTTVRAELPCES